MGVKRFQCSRYKPPDGGHGVMVFVEIGQVHSCVEGHAVEYQQQVVDGF